MKYIGLAMLAIAGVFAGRWAYMYFKTKPAPLAFTYGKGGVPSSASSPSMAQSGTTPGKSLDIDGRSFSSVIKTGGFWSTPTNAGTKLFQKVTMPTSNPVRVQTTPILT